MRQPQISAIFFFAVFLFLLYQAFLIFAVFLTPLVWAALLALVFYPVQAWLTRKLKQRPGLAAFLLTTLVIALVIVPMILLTSLLVTESSIAYLRVQDLIERGVLTEWIDTVRGRLPGLVSRWMPAHLELPEIDLPAIVLKVTNSISAFVVAQATGAVKNVVRFVLNFFLTTFALFFFFRDGERLANSLRAVIPMDAVHKEAVLRRFYTTLSAVVQGALAVAFAQGLLAGIGYWAVGLPFAVLLGCGTGLLSLLPSGAALVWLPAAIYLAAAESLWRGLGLLAWGLLAVSSIDNILRPWIIGGQTRIPTMFLFFGILGGLQVYGFLGMFLAPVLIGTLVAFVQIYREQYVT